MRPSGMDAERIESELAKLPDWTLRDDRNAISRTFRFKTFVEAFGFMTQSALAAEKLDHHPEWSNVYARVDVTLSTHDAGGLTALDFQLAALMDKFARRD
ncbi:4a-hydroxytetrahydrobiopterin dehydratase [Neorhizobium sp. NPDC001467]|uniref:4a-hydroxytetrahydrobiopterin dehydratase n=1 Tax=Neorhizobium sp. NPDC001467 TaxID=3390595 RepID=UPI003D08A836